MTWTDRLLTFLLYALGVVFVAALVHLIAVLAMPELAPNDAYARLSAFTKTAAGPVLLPRPLPGHALTPFEDPALAQAVCMFDLSHGSLHVRGDVDHEGFVSLSFRSRDGRIFYAMTDKSAVHGKIDVRVLTEPQLEALQEQDDEDNPPQELRLVAPQIQGFVLINALVAYPSERAAAEARALAINCAPEAIAQN
ncbi:MAG: DUF1254 domain-containing protein [Methylovirgula sp.]